MAETKSLEEAWRNHGLALTSEELDNAARALALAAHRMGCLTCGYTHHCDGRRRIDELGKGREA